MKLREKYTKEIAPMLKEKLGFKSIMQVPKLEKITINMGLKHPKTKVCSKMQYKI